MLLIRNFEFVGANLLIIMKNSLFLFIFFVTIAQKI
jgi:hypothetical protein